MMPDIIASNIDCKSLTCGHAPLSQAHYNFDSQGQNAMLCAGAHFSLQRFLPLVLLGIIFGTLLVRTRNLLPCVLLHSLWNAYIFWQLTCRGTVVL